MKKVKYCGIIVFMLFIIMATFLLQNVTMSFAATTELNDNHFVPKDENMFLGYEQNRNFDYHNATMLSNHDNALPAITILVHGQDGSSSDWSNNGDKYDYDFYSIVETLRRQTDANVYLAKSENQYLVHKIGDTCKITEKAVDYNGVCKEEELKKEYIVDETESKIPTGEKAERFSLFSILPEENHTTIINKQSTKYITDLSKHMIIVFEATDHGKTAKHSVVNKELHKIIDMISYDYFFLSGRIPKINLISHSRGGLTSIMYATDHQNNVHSLFSIGTPYAGTNLADLGFAQNILPGVFSNDSAKDILDVNMQESIKTAWNDISNNQIQAHALVGSINFNYIVGFLEDNYDKLIEFIGLDKMSLEDIDNFLFKLKVIINQIHTDSSLIFSIAAVGTVGSIITIPTSTFLGVSSLVLSTVLITASSIVMDLSGTLVNLIEESLTKTTLDDKIKVFLLKLQECATFFDDLEHGIQDMIGNSTNMLDYFGDFTIDSESQSANGFNNFTVKKKIYTYTAPSYQNGHFSYISKNFDDSSVGYNLLPIPHLMEPRDADFINYIRTNLEFTSNPATHQGILDLELNNYKQESLNAGEYAAYTFIPYYSGDYTIVSTIGNTVIKIFDITNPDSYILSNSSTGTNIAMTSRLETGKQYKIIVRMNDITQAGSFFIRLSLPKLNPNATTPLSVSPGNSNENHVSLEYSSNTKAFKKISVSNSNIAIEVYLHNEIITKSYSNSAFINFEYGNKYIIKFINNSASIINFSYTVSDLQSLSEGTTTSINIYNSLSYIKFVPNQTTQYTISFYAANFYVNNVDAMIEVEIIKNGTEKVQYQLISGQKQRIILVNLIAGQEYIIKYSNQNIGNIVASILAKKYNNAYSWKVNNQKVDEIVLLRGRSSSYADVTFWYNDIKLDGLISSDSENGNYLNINGNRISVKSNSPLTYSDNSFHLTIQMHVEDNLSIVYNKKLKINVQHGTTPTVTTDDTYSYIVNLNNLTKLSDESLDIVLAIDSQRGDIAYKTISISKTNISGIDLKSILTGYLYSGQIKVSFVSLEFAKNGVNIVYNKQNAPHLFTGTNTISTLQGYFKAGNGSAAPYEISNERELLNMNKMASSMVIYDSTQTVIRGSYKLVSNITLNTSTSTIIQYPFVLDTFDGNYKTIYNFSYSGSDTKIGLFIENKYGTIKNIYMRNIDINYSGSNSYAYIGTIASKNDGNIINCRAYNGKITAHSRSAYVGGIVGSNTLIIEDCDSYINIDSYGSIGGIAAENGGKITNCYTSATLTWLYDGTNSCIGGITGYNTGNVYDSHASVTILWDEKSNNRAILPMMGYIIGWNKGYSINNTESSSYNIYYYYWHFIGYYDQSDHCFKVDDGKIGRQ